MSASRKKTAKEKNIDATPTGDETPKTKKKHRTKVKKSAKKEIEPRAPKETIVFDESFHKQLAALSPQTLSQPMQIETLLSTLVAHKKISAVAGAFSITALGLGIFMNSIPRAMRASEANDLKKLFTSARLYVTEKHSLADEKRLEMFQQLIQTTAAVKLRDMASKIDQERLFNFGLTTAQELEIQGKITEKASKLSLKEIATLLTLANFYTPKDLNKNVIYNPEPSDMLPFCYPNREFGSSPYSMNAGFFSGRHISQLSNYVAEMFVKQSFDLAERFDFDSKEPASHKTELVRNLKDSIKNSSAVTKEVEDAQEVLRKFNL